MASYDPMAYYGGVKELHVSTTDTAIAVAISIGGMILVLGLAWIITMIIDKHNESGDSDRL